MKDIEDIIKTSFEPTEKTNLLFVTNKYIFAFIDKALKVKCPNFERVAGMCMIKAGFLPGVVKIKGKTNRGYYLRIKN